MAGMWTFRARDAIATLAHGAWGAFWIAYLILNIMVGTHVLTAPTPWYHNPEVGFWFFALAITTCIAMLGAIAEMSFGIVAVLGTLATGSGILAGAFVYGSHGWTQVAGWVFVVSAGLAWYMVLAMLMISVTGRSVLPTFKINHDPNAQGHRPMEPTQLEWAEPGVKMGQ